MEDKLSKCESKLTISNNKLTDFNKNIHYMELEKKEMINENEILTEKIKRVKEDSKNLKNIDMDDFYLNK